jgi:hypothetical protein
MSDIKMNEILRRQKNLKAWAIAIPAGYTGLFALLIAMI